MVALPYLSIGYGITRLYGFTVVVLSIFFVIGGIVISRTIKISPYIVILIILIPYFFSITGITYSISGYPRSIILDSNGNEFDLLYVHDQESCAAKWMGKSVERNLSIYSDKYSISRLESQAGLKSFDIMPFVMNNNSINEGYIYLRYTAVVNGKLLTMNNQWLNISSEYPQSFLEYSKIYGNGGSESTR